MEGEEEQRRGVESDEETEMNNADETAKKLSNGFRPCQVSNHTKFNTDTFSLKQ